MEMMAVIAGLEALKKPCDATVFSDSRYVVNALTASSVDRWSKARWRKPDGEGIPNEDLWKRLLYLTKRLRVKVRWVAGHGVSEENLICDALARDAARRHDLPPDRYFEAEQRRKYAARAKVRRKRT